VAHYFPPYPYFTNEICKRGILTESFRLIDVGVRGGFHDRWQAFGDHLELWGFDALYEDGVAPLIAANKHPDRIRYLHCALGDKDETRPFRYYPENPSSSHFAAANGTDVIDENWREVPIRRLDTLFADGTIGPAIDFMKLDAETYEIEIVKGAGEMLSRSGILGIESETNFLRTGRNPRSHFVELYEQLAPYGMTLNDLGVVRQPKPPLPNGFPQEIVGGRFVMRSIGRIFVCDCLFLGAVFEAVAMQAKCSVNRLLKMIAVAELYGLQDISLGILFDNRRLLADRLDVEQACGWLMREHPHQTLGYRDYAEGRINAIPLDSGDDPRRTAENIAAKVVAERDRMLAEQKQLLAEQGRMLAQQRELLAERDRVLAGQEATLLAMRNSRSWRMTAPLRKAMTWLRK
jgi:FkbM family methyltransferase